MSTGCIPAEKWQARRVTQFGRTSAYAPAVGFPLAPSIEVEQLLLKRAMLAGIRRHGAR
jgi:hypothetical protein